MSDQISLLEEPAPKPAKQSRAKPARPPVVRVELVRDAAPDGAPAVCDMAVKAVELVRAHLGRASKEHFVAILLDARSQVLGITTISIGTLSASLVHPREVFQPAILANAAALVVAHNHPSGDPAPSAEDRDATRRLLRSGELLGIPLLDHVIVGRPPRDSAAEVSGSSYFSFKEAGILS